MFEGWIVIEGHPRTGYERAFPRVFESAADAIDAVCDSAEANGRDLAEATFYDTDCGYEYVFYPMNGSLIPSLVYEIVRAKRAL